MRNISYLSYKKPALTLCAAAFTLLYATSSFAQVPGTQTTTADPGRQQEQLQAQGTLPSVSERIEIREMNLQKAPEGAEKMKFKLKSLKLKGATVYHKEELQKVYEEKVGTTISLADVYTIATSLTNKYRNDGYILTQVVVPPQTIEGGDVELKVVEGFIEKIIVEGDEDESSLELIRNYANGIELNKALNIKDLERHLLIIGDLPGMDARSVLSPSKTTTGAADLRIILSRDAYEGYLGADNYGSRYLGPLEVTGSASSNSVFGNNEKITAQIVAAPDPGTDTEGMFELGYYALGYEQPVPFMGLGTKMELFASYTDTQPGYDLKEFDVQGISQYFSVKVKHPFIRSRSTNLIGHALIDYREVSSRNNVQATLKDHIRAVRAGANYQMMDKFFGLGISAFNVELSKGLTFLNASRPGDANMTRTMGDPTFTKLTGDMQRLQRITSGVNLLVAAKGQWASGPLLSSEEFGVGGASFGRGYDPSEIIGDEGIAGKVEVQWNNPYPTNSLNDYQFYGFYDAGRTWNEDATTSARKRDVLTSAGFGVRAELPTEIKADVTVAFPLNHEVQTRGDKGASLLLKLSRDF